MFIVTRANDREKKYLEPDDDLRRAITGDELLTGIYEDLEKFFAINESSIANNHTIAQYL